MIQWEMLQLKGSNIFSSGWAVLTVKCQQLSVSHLDWGALCCHVRALAGGPQGNQLVPQITTTVLQKAFWKRTAQSSTCCAGHRCYWVAGAGHQQGLRWRTGDTGEMQGRRASSSSQLSVAGPDSAGVGDTEGSATSKLTKFVNDTTPLQAFHHKDASNDARKELSQLWVQNKELWAAYDVA